MKKMRPLLIGMACLGLIVDKTDATNRGYWQQFVHYQMNVFLDPEEHLLTGESSITYVNHSPDTLDRIYMHLYPNAFRKGSVKYREYQRAGLIYRHLLRELSGDSLSYIRIKELEVVGSDGRSSSDFRIDDTILEANVPEKLAPGDSVTIHLNWEHKVREHIGRAGYEGEQYDFAQWYPKMVVHDEKGWHNVPFHAIGEFYGEFGTFDVTIDVPERFIVGATGTVVDGDPGWASVTVDTSVAFSDWVAVLDSSKIDSSSRRQVTFHAENVHDFAWITSPDFVYEHGEWDGIDIHVLFSKRVGEKWTKVVRERSERAVQWLSTRFGPYPYPQVTVTHGLLGGGMEYPMLVMNGRESEGLIVHEVGHIWFYGILGNNEVDEAWLDEGFTTFQTRWYQTDRYPPNGIDLDNTTWYDDFQKRHWSFASQLDDAIWSSVRFMTSPHNEPIATKSYLSSGGGEYRQNAYTKPSLMLYSLRYILGPDVFDRAMRTYFDRWKLKHTNEWRFREVMEEVSGQDLGWFFDRWLHEAYYTDYALDAWSTRRLQNGEYEVTAHIVNKSEMLYPLDIEVIQDDGETYRTRWTNHLYRWEDDVTLTVPARPAQLILDPDDRILDVDLRDNVSGSLPDHVRFNWPGMNYNPRKAYVVRWNPVLWYHELDGIKPGLSFRRSYGPWHRFNVFLTYGAESQKLHGKLTYSESLRRIFPSLMLTTVAYSLEGVRGGKVDLGYSWSKYYGVPPHHQLNLGLYVTDTGNTDYTDLYEEGEILVLYGKYGVSARRGSQGASLNLEVSSSPGGLSDWSFARFLTRFELGLDVKKVRIGGRLMLGTMWTDKGGAPIQEKFTIRSASSGTYFARPYLRHPSSFYNVKIGDEFLRDHFHLYGDANLRGYYHHGFAGAEDILTGTVEAAYGLPTPWIDTYLRLFLDGGWLWSEKDNLDGNFLSDGGPGLAFKKKMFGTTWNFRIDFPAWLNHTENPAGAAIESVDLSRWVIGFDVGL